MRTSPLTYSLAIIEKNPMYNWNPPVRDQLQAVSADDVDDQTELEEFYPG